MAAQTKTGQTALPLNLNDFDARLTGAATGGDEDFDSDLDSALQLYVPLEDLTHEEQAARRETLRDQARTLSRAMVEACSVEMSDPQFSSMD